MDDSDLPAFLAALPKTELHIHLVGAASVDTVLELARRHPDAGVPTEREALAVYYEFTDFAHFIEVYISVNALVRTPADVEALVVGAARDMADQAVRYAELTVTPDGHLLMGIAAEAIAAALATGRRRARDEHGVELAWVFDIPGELGLPSAERTIDWVERHAPEGTVGFGLGGPEIGVPRPQFEPYFDKARAAGLHSVPHAGETTGPQTIRDAINFLGAERVGHGIAAAQDATLMAELVDRGIVLEVCPTSNLRTRAVSRLDQHPWHALVAAGVAVTLNSDDPGMFDTTLVTEYVAASELLGVSRQELVAIARTGVEKSYAPDATRRRILAEIADHAS